jgi:hypothetical protein
MMRPMVVTFKDLPSLNSESLINGASGGPVNASSYPAPATTTKPAHTHNGSTTTDEQKGTPATMPMPMPEQQLK